MINDLGYPRCHVFRISPLPDKAIAKGSYTVTVYLIGGIPVNLPVSARLPSVGFCQVTEWFQAGPEVTQDTFAGWVEDNSWLIGQWVDFQITMNPSVHIVDRPYFEGM
jgi:hypothetical protein